MTKEKISMSMDGYISSFSDYQYSKALSYALEFLENNIERVKNEDKVNYKSTVKRLTSLLNEIKFGLL